MQLSPLSRTSLPDAIAEQLLRLLREGDLKPGDRLPSETELGQMLGVGRTTVREALKGLVTLGLLERSRRGTFVRRDAPAVMLTPGVALLCDEVVQLYEARKVLESALAGMAAELATEEDLNLMRQALADIEAVDPSDARCLLEADMRFHAQIAETAGNSILLQMFLAIRERLIVDFTDAVKIPGILELSESSHREVFEAIEAGDARGASEAMRRGLSAVEDAFVALRSARTAANPAGAHANGADRVCARPDEAAVGGDRWRRKAAGRRSTGGGSGDPQPVAVPGPDDGHQQLDARGEGF